MINSSSDTAHTLHVHSSWDKIPLNVTYESSEPRPPILVHTLWIHLPLIVISNIPVISATYFIKELHTPYNTIIAGLAIVSLAMGLVNIPETWLRENIDTEIIVRGTLIACSIFWFLSFFFSRLCLLYIFLMSLERFLSIKFPIKYRHISSIKRVVVTMLVFCLTTALEFIVVLLFPSKGWIYGLPREKNVHQCWLQNRLPTFYLEYMGFIIVGTIVLVSASLTLSVGFISHKRLKRSLARPQNILRNDDLKRQLLQLKITVAIMCIYVILWIPYFVTAMINTKYGNTTYLLMNLISRHCSFINAWINTIVYAGSRTTYRKAYLFFLTNSPRNWPNANKYLLKENFYKKHSMIKLLKIKKANKQPIKGDLSGFEFKRLRKSSKRCSESKSTANSATIRSAPSSSNDGIERHDAGFIDNKSIASSQLKPKAKNDICQKDKEKWEKASKLTLLKINLDKRYNESKRNKLPVPSVRVKDATLSLNDGIERQDIGFIDNNSIASSQQKPKTKNKFWPKVKFLNRKLNKSHSDTRNKKVSVPSVIVRDTTSSSDHYIERQAVGFVDNKSDAPSQLKPMTINEMGQKDGFLSELRQSVSDSIIKKPHKTL